MLKYSLRKPPFIQKVFTPKLISPFSNAKKSSSNIIKKLLGKEFTEILYLCRPERKGFFYGTILTFASSAIFMLLPQALSQITNLTSQKYEKIESNDSNELKEMKNIKNNEINKKYFNFLLLWVSVFGLSGLVTYLRRYISNDLANRISVRLRRKIYGVIISKNYSFFNSTSTAVSSLVHKITNDITAISNTISVDLVFGIRGFFFIIGGSLYLLIKIPEWTIMSLGTMTLLVYLSKIVGKKLRVSKQEEVEALTKLSGLANERLSSIKLIKISNTEQLEINTYEKQLHHFYSKSQKVSKYLGLNHGILDGLGQTALICILAYGSYLVSMGIGSPEMLTSSIYSLYVGLGFRSLIVVYTEMTKVAALYNGIFELIGTIKDDKEYNSIDLFKKEIENNVDSTLINKHLNEPPEIIFQNVDFKYPDRNNYILKNFNLKIKSGEIIAIQGESGSGKSTILNLLCKLYHIEKGNILINKNDLNNMDTDWIQQNIAYVTQEPILFMSSIYENIIYGNQGFDISLDNVQRCAKIANADDFICKLEQGYHTILSEKGGNLSGGQRQRLILARVLIKNPKIIILDEATSSLDPEGEKQIISELKDICKGRTCIIITHKIENYQGLIQRVVKINGENMDL